MKISAIAIAAGLIAASVSGAVAANRATIVQLGKYNSAYTSQYGSKNTSTDVQFGKYNSAYTSQYGKKNDAAIGQIGKYNSGAVIQTMP